MTPDRNDLTHDEPENGVLADGASIDTAAIGLLGGFTAQVDVTMPVAHDDEDYEPDEAIDDAVPLHELDALGLSPVTDAAPFGRGDVGADLTIDANHATDAATAEPADAELDTDTVIVGIIEPDADDGAHENVAFEDTALHATAFEDAAFEDAVVEDTVRDETVREDTVHEDTVHEDTVHEDTVHDAVLEDAVHEETVPEDAMLEPTVREDAGFEEAAFEDSVFVDPGFVDTDVASPIEVDRDLVHAVLESAEVAPVGEPGADVEPLADGDVNAKELTDAGAADGAAADAEIEETEIVDATFPDDAATATPATGSAAARPAPVIAPRDSLTSATASGAVTAAAASASDAATAAERHRAAHPTERVRTHNPAAEVALTPRRLGEIESTRESADLLTADRLLDPHAVQRPEPEGMWQHLVYSLSGRRINLGDGKRARARKELDRRIGAALGGRAKFVPVLSRKGGVGKTTITTLLGMALADARDDRVIAVDANPDRGTLAERIGRTSGKTVRDLARTRESVIGYNDLSAIVARDDTRLDVLASDSDPHVSEAFSDRDYHDVATLAAHYYSIVLTDTGTGIVHSVMGATLDLADQIVVVAGLSVDEARLASETLTWLESNGYIEQVRNAVVVLNTARPGAPLVRADELEAHFRSRVRAVVRMPYDAHIATGSAIAFRELQPATRTAARQLAALVVEGLRALNAAA